MLIENQLERTDHTHLGQLMTYAAGLDAVTVVWIAARFTEEHRAALDWLNRITNDTFRFFGAEVELWRIAESVPAPRFNIVSKPNNWARSVTQAARALGQAELSDARSRQLDYWTAFEVVRMRSAAFSGERKPQPQSWMAYPIGRAGFSLNAAMVRPKRKIKAELYISNPDAKAFFYLLRAQASAIEDELTFELLWEELPDRRDTRVSCALEADPEDRVDWPRQHEWLATRLGQLRRVLDRRVRSLDASQWRLEQNEVTDL